MRGLVVAMSLLLTAVSYAQLPISGTALGITDHVGGKEIQFWVHDTDLKDSPEWADPEHTAPPFNIADAIAVSRPELQRYALEQPEQWYVSSVTLHRLDEKPHWFYVVEWRSRVQSLGDGLSVPVLMNGKAVIGTISSDEKKSKKAQAK